MFQGIPKEMQPFMSELRERNSKPWYDAHKPDYQKFVKAPFGELAAELAETVRPVDDRIRTEPRYTVSRARRDTRFSPDKTLYRNNVWITFKPAVDRWDLPLFYFEVMPDYFRYGLAFTWMSPEFMRRFRAYITDNPNDFKRALKEAQDVGVFISGDRYKKPKPDAPRGLEEWFSYKNFWLNVDRFDCEVLQTRDFVEDVKRVFTGCAHFYRLLSEASDYVPVSYF